MTLSVQLTRPVSSQEVVRQTARIGQTAPRALRHQVGVVIRGEHVTGEAPPIGDVVEGAGRRPSVLRDVTSG